jgi:hypothetical protein
MMSRRQRVAPPCMHLHCSYRTRMSNSSYRTCPKGTAWAPMSRCGLKDPTFSAERVSYASERKAANGTQLPLSEFILQKADVSIRASQGSSQATTTPRLATQSRCQCSVLACPVTPSYRALPQFSPDAPGVICECFRPHRPGTSSTRGLLGVAPRLHGTISGGGKNVCSIAVRIHQHTLYLDQGHQGLGSSHESTRDTLSLVHRPWYLEHFDAISPDSSTWLCFWLDDFGGGP